MDTVINFVDPEKHEADLATKADLVEGKLAETQFPDRLSPEALVAEFGVGGFAIIADPDGFVTLTPTGPATITPDPDGYVTVSNGA